MTPDLNPVERLWDHMKRRLRKLKKTQKMISFHVALKLAELNLAHTRTDEILATFMIFLPIFMVDFGQKLGIDALLFSG